MDELSIRLFTTILELLQPYDHLVGTRVLSQLLAADSVTKMCLQGDIHKLQGMKAALLFDFEADIDEMIRRAYADDTFRRN